ncbi:HNH endonuclease [Aetokthonos hydrillicola Thurmond2011]|jgi:5-methylcytosine-specific restriction endonuclease McrA|uniref:HNH endonuclease n=1 Tax=Aetokthonos hydrillicola Thurmond2011 TaxID=2712845 RepID=A0AAP5M883_9CYAN|nr:HNH endonuclease [Aetokthonos hydrillicola]MBO3462952.1 HNH endonuclease [Aetokthonos hydrillicola CCALA 1050]MBW4590169.1 HNH endonuclease [Aetokthonos hydrillicola CCALA 1050]MDR9893313.1 HNH endonuclease [Aetokthonos hydrillicola Thurmond2011]
MEVEPKSQGSQILQNSVVVFSKNYLPVVRVNIKRAVVLLLTGQAEALEFTSKKFWEIRSPSIVLQVPEHIRLIVGNPERHWKVPSVNRREVLKRDHHTCQYCGSRKHLTLDHVIPRSKGGQHTWDNVVTACATCNQKKRDYLLHEIGMVLKNKPRAPVHPAVAFGEQFWNTQRFAENE